MAEAWWKGAVIYQIYPRSFMDSNGDGIGDLQGIISKLDYVKDLGVDAIWLSPFFKSPMKDFGYDISDYEDVDPIFGTLEDFDKLLKEAHARGLKIIIDQVLNHTSDLHPWFMESRSSKDNSKADWYIWLNGEKGTPPNNWLSYFGGSAWEWDENREQYYLHLFVKEQPDLNWRNPEVKAAIMKTVEYWLDRGVDGFRFDVVNLYYKDEKFRDNPRKDPADSKVEFANYHMVFNRDRPETLLAVEEIQDLVDGKVDGVTVGEVSTNFGVEQYLEYTKPGRLNLAFNFDFKDLPEFNVDLFRNMVSRCERVYSNMAWPSYVLGNHDSARFISRFGDGKNDPAIARILATMLLTLRGTPFIYNGEEIGMTQAEIPYEKIVDPQGKNLWPEVKGRDGCRTPMQWDFSKHAGFSTVEPWLPVNENKSSVNIRSQKDNPDSLLNYYKSLLKFRKESKALSLGKYRLLKESGQVFAYEREYESERKIVILNFSEKPQKIDLSIEVEFGTAKKTGTKIIGEFELVPFEVLIGKPLI